MEEDPIFEAAPAVMEELLKLRKEIRTLKREKHEMKGLLVYVLRGYSPYFDFRGTMKFDRDIVLAAFSERGVTNFDGILSSRSLSHWKNDPEVANALFRRGVFQWNELSAVCKADPDVIYTALARGEIKLYENDPGDAPLAPPGWKRNGTFLKMAMESGWILRDDDRLRALARFDPQWALSALKYSELGLRAKNLPCLNSSQEGGRSGQD